MTFLVSTLIGGFLSYICRETRIFEKLLSKHLLKVCRTFKIPHYMMSAVVLSLVNSRIEHTIAYDNYRQGLINDWYLVYYNLVLSPLRLINISITYIAPQVLIALGMYAGILYILFMFLKSILTSLIAVVYYRLFKRKIKVIDYHECVEDSVRLDYPDVKRRKFSLDMIKRGFLNSLNILKSLAPKFFIILAIISILYIFNVFTYLNTIFREILQMFDFLTNSQMLTIISIGCVSPSLATYIAGSMLISGMLSVKEVLISLYIGNMLFILFFDFIKHSFPFYVSIYPVKVAYKLTLSIILSTLITTPIILLIIYVLPL